jgi:tRNA dimethylallyltransferase
MIIHLQLHQTFFQVSEKKLIVVGGPTASGKTKLAIQLAQHFKCAVLSADSRQFYRQMSIGTAKPTLVERAMAPHYFIDSLDITQDYSVGDFERDALTLLASLYQTNNYAILVGGSGLYHKALCEGLDEMPDVAEDFRQQVEALFAAKGIEGLQKELKQLDFEYFNQVDIHNRQRVMRALSVCYATGKPFTEFRKNIKKTRNFKPFYFCTDLPRPDLYEKINHRVEVMLQDGLIDEVKSLCEYKSKNALQTVGYKELFDYWDGRYPDISIAIDKIKQHSRNYAKRQITWFKHQGDYHFIPPDEYEKIISIVNKAQ